MSPPGEVSPQANLSRYKAHDLNNRNLKSCEHKLMQLTQRHQTEESGENVKRVKMLKRGNSLNKLDASGSRDAKRRERRAPSWGDVR